MNWDTLDWPALNRLRETFLNIRTGGDSYWTSPSDLESYDATFGQRIGWKWNAVLRGLNARRWSPPAREVVDWGCGSGIAARRVIEAFGAERFDTLRVHDRSPLAMEFA